MNENVIKAKRCYGCGAALQTVDEKLEGYVPENLFNERDVLLCQRCFKLRNYSEDTPLEPVISEDFFKLLEQAQASNALFVYVVDLFNFEASFNREINKALQKSDVILFGTKRDLLPKSVKDEKLIEFLKERAEAASLKVREIFVTSATKNFNLKEILPRLQDYGCKRNIYVIGSVSSGKSSLINAFLKVYKNETSHYITTSIYPNTTLKVIEIPLDEKISIFDTPGLAISNSMLGLMEREVIRDIVPRTEVKPRVYQLLPQQSLLIGGIARIDFLSGSRTSFTLYVSNDVKVLRTQLRWANQTFANLIKFKKIRPISKKIKSIADLDAFDITVGEGQKCDISWTGLGWVSFKENNQMIRVYAPQGVSIAHNKSKI